jgi:hypothetical protein
VAQAGFVAAEDGELVVHGIDAHEAGGVADPVRHPGVETRAPEPVGLVHVGRVQAQVAELGDPGGAAERHRAGHGLLLADQLDPVAERVVEGDELADAPRPGLGFRTAVDGQPGALELGFRDLERVGIGHRETGGDHPGRALHQGQAVVAVIGAQVRDLAVHGRDQLQADNLGREPGGGGEIGRPGADVGDVGKRDHGA